MHADDASGKKSASMQKHFRHLVNETASKQRFLRSLHRSSSSVREGSGSLPVNLQEASGIKQEELEIDKEVLIKQEPDMKQEPDSLGQEIVAGTCHDLSSGLPALAGLPESLGEELGDAACLKADPDSLMQDARDNPDSLSVPQPASDKPAGTNLRPGSVQDGSRQHEDQYQSVVDEFMDILGDAVQADTAKSLVARACGNLAAAINSFYDSTPVKTEPSEQPGKAAETAQASSSETSAKRVGQGADAGAATTVQKRAGESQTGKQKGKGKKRVAAAQELTGGGGGSSKKAKQTDTAQRSIATFFGGRQTSQVQNLRKAMQPSVHQQNEAIKASQDIRQGVQAKACQQAVKSEETSSLNVPATAKQHHTEHIDTIDLVEDTVEVKPEPMSDDPTISSDDNATEHASIKAEDAIAADLTAGDTGQQLPDSNHPAASQPLHPFFGSRQATKPASTTGKPADKNPLPQEALNMTASELCKQAVKAEKPSRVNPFQKVHTDPDKDVPADAVLLSTAEYDPVGMAVWVAGQATPYRHISRAFQAMESTTKRLRIGDAIANMFRSILALSPGELWTSAAVRVWCSL